MSEALEKLEPPVLAHFEHQLAAFDAKERVAWALEHLPGCYALSSSFGAQAAVMLHLVSSLQPEIPVILIDTGYLFPETYRFADELRERLQLNLKVYRGTLSPAWQEARYGRLWEQGREGIEQYNRMNKTEPMRQALSELAVATWFAGLRRDQSRSRATTHLIDYQNGRYKVHPIADWNDRDVGDYLNKYNLPYHPLWEQGYISIGDTHTTTRWRPGASTEATRFFGIKRECGLHQDV